MWISRAEQKKHCSAALQISLAIQDGLTSFHFAVHALDGKPNGAKSKAINSITFNKLQSRSSLRKQTDFPPVALRRRKIPSAKPSRKTTSLMSQDFDQSKFSSQKTRSNARGAHAKTCKNMGVLAGPPFAPSPHPLPPSAFCPRTMPFALESLRAG